MPVQMGTFVCLMLSLDLNLTEVCFRCATLMVNGLQYVTMIGLNIILLWLANNLVIITQVSVLFNTSLALSFSQRAYIILFVFGY